VLKRFEIGLWISSVSLVLFGVFALASTDNYGAETVLLGAAFLLLWPMGETLDRRTRLYRQITLTITAAYMLVLLITITSRALLDTVTALILFIMGYKLVHVKKRHDYHQLFLMTFFLIVAASSRADNAWISLILLGYLVSAIWGLLLLQLVFDAKQQGARHVTLVMDAGAASYPGELSMAGAMPERVILRPRSFLGVVSLLSLLSLALTIGLFTGLPRMEAGVLGRRVTITTQAGVGQPVQLARASGVASNTSPVMEAQFPEEPGGRVKDELLYWRTTSLEMYTGTGWKRSPIVRYSYEEYYRSETDDDLVLLGFYDGATSSSRGSNLLTRTPLRSSRRIHQSISLNQPPTEGLPCLSLVQRVLSPQKPVEWDHAQRDFTIYPADNDGLPFDYEAWSEVASPSPEELRTAPQTSRDYRLALSSTYHRLLTYQDLQLSTQRLAEDLTASYDNAFDKVSAIQNWLQGSGFAYSTSFPKLPELHPVDHFIHTSRLGHCELFASAMALMVRSLQIPARVVSGYRGGEWNESTKSYVVRGDMAHLWAEVFFPEYGWVLFDPSPVSGTQFRRASPVLAKMSHLMSKTRMLWYRHVIGFRGNYLSKLLPQIGLAFQPRESPAPNAPNASGAARAPFGISPDILKVIAAAAAGGVLLLWLRLYHRKRAWRLALASLSKDQQRAVKLYAALRRKLDRQGTAWQAMTAGEIVDELKACNWPDRDSAIEMIDVYNKTRFGNRLLPHEDYRRWRKLVRSLGHT
jgi:protein-glutamine gamma-glutamyltransferase